MRSAYGASSDTDAATTRSRCTRVSTGNATSETPSSSARVLCTDATASPSARDSSAKLAAESPATSAADSSRVLAVAVSQPSADPAAKRVTETLRIPTIGIGAGPDCDAQVLVWQDMAGLRGGRAPRFVKKYLDMRTDLGDAARTYAAEVASGAFPAAEHSFEE